MSVENKDEQEEQCQECGFDEIAYEYLQELLAIKNPEVLPMLVEARSDFCDLMNKITLIALQLEKDGHHDRAKDATQIAHKINALCDEDLQKVIGNAEKKTGEDAPVSV